jgi:hypothetical protein
VKSLLDENLRRKLVAALRAEGHDAESVHTLRMQGLDNGRLYEFADASFDTCFTRDGGFANKVRQGRKASRLKPLRVTLQQRPQEEFVLNFVSAFRLSDWKKVSHGDDLPRRIRRSPNGSF